MKINKILIAFILCLIWAVNIFATPTVKTTVLDVKGKQVWLKILYTSDGTDAAAVDIVAGADTAAKQIIEKGFTCEILSTDPGTAGVAPNGATDVIFTDIGGFAVKTTTGDAISHTAKTTGITMWSDYGHMPAISSKWYITVEDLGDDGDQMTYVLFGWVENK